MADCRPGGVGERFQGDVAKRASTRKVVSSHMSVPVILIIGKTGQVGWELRRTLAPLGRVVSVDYPEVDLTNPDSVRKWPNEVRPNVIVNAAAYTAVDKAETELEKCQQVNGVAPGILAEEAKK